MRFASAFAPQSGLRARSLRRPVCWPCAKRRNGTKKKADGSTRPLGIQCLEDKIVQQAVVYVLNAIYEPDFMGFSYGFRPGRGQHDALDAIQAALYRKKINWVLDADIRKFFDSMSHEWIRVIQGHMNYFAVPGNGARVSGFVFRVSRLWLKMLRRQSQRHRMPWSRFAVILNFFFPKVRILHPQPLHRFDARTRGRSPVR